jgi:hypothetical protein
VSRHRALSASVAALLGLTVVQGCVPASPDQDTYLQKTSVTVGSALSEVATVGTVVSMLHDEKMFRSTAIAQVRDSQSSLDTDAGAFDEVDPPTDLDWLHDRTDTLLSDATDAVLAARLAIDRREKSRYAGIAKDLASIADRLDALEARVS